MSKLWKSWNLCKNIFILIPKKNDLVISFQNLEVFYFVTLRYSLDSADLNNMFKPVLSLY